MAPYQTLLVHVRHTYSAGLYSFSGTADGGWGAGGAFVDVMNAPATQKEDGVLNPLPSEFMVIQASLPEGGGLRWRGHGPRRAARRRGALCRAPRPFSAERTRRAVRRRRGGRAF